MDEGPVTNRPNAKIIKFFVLSPSPPVPLMPLFLLCHREYADAQSCELRCVGLPTGAEAGFRIVARSAVRSSV